MYVIHAQSVSDALATGLHQLRHAGDEIPSRNGPVIVSPNPIMTNYLHPKRHVLVSEQRDANPFFHLFEAIWMLAGRDNLSFPQKFVSTFGQFSDDGKTLHGAYGYRWRQYFGYDQLQMVASEIKKNHDTRRAVLSMWDGGHWDEEDAGDLHKAASGGKDVPCNTHIYFDTLGGKLNMTVCCRSNDVILGAHGANAVHFSILLEYMSILTMLPMGIYRQFSNNYHCYDNQLKRKDFHAYADAVKADDVYMQSVFGRKTNLICLINGDLKHFDDDCHRFADSLGFGLGAKSAFFEQVVCPMYRAWSCWKDKEFDVADKEARTIMADDWRTGAQSWLATRAKRREKNS